MLAAYHLTIEASPIFMRCDGDEELYISLETMTRLGVVGAIWGHLVH